MKLIATPENRQTAESKVQTMGPRGLGLQLHPQDEWL
jgi:hypothetical protein